MTCRKLALFVALQISSSILLEAEARDSLADANFLNKIAQEHIKSKLKAHKHLLRGKRPKKVILFIGDGMGISMVTSYRIAKNQRAHNDYVQAPLFFETFPYTGLVKTYSYSDHVTDSAAAAVALYAGRKVDNGKLGMRPGVPKICTTEPDDLIKDGIGDKAVEKGIAVGVVTNARITDATPAALYAKGVQRKLEYDKRNKITREVRCYNDIALQILHRPAIEFQVLMGGGRAYLMNATRNGKRCDGRNIDVEWENFGGKRKVLRSRQELEQYEAAEHEKVLGLFAKKHIDYAIQRPADEPDLMLMTKKAIEVLEKSGKEYFLMVEGGLIDKAEHANSMHAAFDEMREFEDAIKEARRMTDPSETLILVTADHAHALTIPGYVPLQHSIFENYNLGKHSVPSMLFAVGPGYRGGFENEKLAGNSSIKSYLQPSAIYADRGYHGGEDVGIWADGPFAELFTGTMENTDIAYAIKYLMCIGNVGQNVCDAPEQQSSLFTQFTNYIIQRDPNEIAFLLLVLTTVLFVMMLILVIVLVMCIRAMDLNSRSNIQIDEEESKSDTERISEESV